jgi:putative membrane protein
MTEPLKPRIDFDGPLEEEKAQILKSARARPLAQRGRSTRLDVLQDEEGAAGGGGICAAAKRSLWRKMVSAGLSLASAWWRRACSGR